MGGGEEWQAEKTKKVWGEVRKERYRNIDTQTRMEGRCSVVLMPSVARKEHRTKVPLKILIITFPFVIVV
jgi:hypothetical protein